MKGRGSLTEKAQEIAKKFLGREITVVELRMYPYIQYVMMNDQKIDPIKCNQEDREVLALLRKAGHIEGGASGLRITKEFWDYLCGILFETYVDIG